MMPQIRLVHIKIFPNFLSSPRPLLLKHLLKSGIGDDDNPPKVIAWEVQILGTLESHVATDKTCLLLHR